MVDVLLGHFQIIFSRKYCPLFRSRLDWLSRMLYCSGVWSYVINAFTTPIFMAVPIITIWVGESIWRGFTILWDTAFTLVRFVSDLSYSMLPWLL
jgi:hypothetical protein